MNLNGLLLPLLLLFVGSGLGFAGSLAAVDTPAGSGLSEVASRASPGAAGQGLEGAEGTSSQAPSLRELEALLADRSPVLAGREAMTRAAHESVGPESALPDPVFEFMLQDVGFPDMTIGDAEMSMASFEVRQNVLFPGKRKARREAASAASRVRSRQWSQLQRKLVMELRTLYARLYALDRERHALLAARELLDLLKETVAVRYSAGESDQEAVLKVQLELFRVLEREADLRTRRQGLVAVLNGMLDLPGDAPFGEVAELPPTWLPPGELQDQAAARSPEVLVKTAALETAERELRAARMEARPNLSVGGGGAYRGDLDPVAIFRLGVEIPFWRRSKVKAVVSARDYDVQAAGHELRASKAAARADLAAWLARRANAQNQVRLYEEAILPQTSATVDAARASYTTGQGLFSTVIEDFGLWLEARVGLANRKAEEFIAWARVCYLAGVDSGSAGRAGEGP